MAWLVALGGLGVLVAGLVRLQQHGAGALALLALAAGVALWGWWLWRFSETEQLLPVSETRPSARAVDRASAGSWFRLGMLAVAGLGAAVAWQNTSGNTFRASGVLPWLASVGLWLAAWWPRKVDALARPDWRNDWRRHVPLLLALAGIILLGAFFRFHRLDAVPLDPTSDHAEKLLDVQDVLDGKRPIFFERNTGREPGQFYVTAGLVEGFGKPVTFGTLKWGTAWLDLLAIPVIFLLASELAGRWTGLAAAALYAVSAWPVALARMGLRFAFAPIFSALALWLLLRYLRTRDRRDALLCGLVTGIGLFGYSPFRVVALAVGVGLAIALVADVRQRRRPQFLIADAALLVTTAALVFLPLAHYMTEKPDMFWQRVTMTADDTGTSTSKDARIFLRNNLNAALGFHWRGDSTMVNFTSYAPILDRVTGAALLAGLATLLYWIARRRDTLRGAILLAIVPVLALSSTLALRVPWENPSINRLGPLVPVVFVLAALPFGLLIERGIAVARARRIAVLGVALAIGIVLLITAQQNYTRYFDTYAEQYRQNVANSGEVVQAIRGAAAVGITPGAAWLVESPHWIDNRNISFMLGDPDWHHSRYVNAATPLPALASAGERPALVVIKADSPRLEEARRQWPDGVFTLVPSAVYGKDIVAIYLPTQAGNP